MNALQRIVENRWFNLLVALALIVTSVQDVWSDMKALAAFHFGAHHGVFLLGIVQTLKTLPQLSKTVQAVEGVEKKL